MSSATLGIVIIYDGIALSYSILYDPEFIGIQSISKDNKTRKAYIFAERIRTSRDGDMRRFAVR